MRRQKFSILLSVFVLVAGCYYPPNINLGGAPRSQGGPGGPRLRPVGLSVGANMGAIDVASESDLADGLESSVAAGVSMAIWPVQVPGMNFGVVLDVASAQLNDPAYGGTMTLTPVTASAVISISDPQNLHPGLRWRMGAGIGSLGISHSDLTTEFSAIPIGVFTFGQEIQGRGVGVMRLYWAIDFMAGEPIESDTGAEFWDLSSVYNFKVGLEVGF